jgi:predicted nucleic acid-binding Zn finger protein
VRIVQVSYNHWDVYGLNDVYMVSLKPYESCTCMWWTLKAKECRHLRAVKKTLNNAVK